DKQLLFNIHTYLSEEEILFVRADCFDTISIASRGDMIYSDPPYDESTVVYNDKLQKQQFQIDIANALNLAVKRGVVVFNSNSNTPLVKTLFKDWTRIPINVASRIGNVSNKRNAEILMFK
ncbi:MAG: hypothetical protein EOP45_23775, partial [Sphingobacteriaceae bacterium]